jgi:hypothetical protein
MSIVDGLTMAANKPAIIIIITSCFVLLLLYYYTMMYMAGTRSKVWKFKPMGLDLPIVKIGPRGVTLPVFVREPIFWRVPVIHFLCGNPLLGEIPFSFFVREPAFWHSIKIFY